MPRQRLPDGWAPDSDGDLRGPDASLAVHCDDNGLVLSIDLGNENTEVIAESDTYWIQRELPADVALPLFRNAGLDPIFSAAKRVVELMPWRGAAAEAKSEFESALNDLKRLVDESEEPE